MPPYPVWDGISPRANFEAKFRLKFYKNKLHKGGLQFLLPNPRSSSSVLNSLLLIYSGYSEIYKWNFWVQWLHYFDKFGNLIVSKLYGFC